MNAKPNSIQPSLIGYLKIVKMTTPQFSISMKANGKNLSKTFKTKAMKTKRAETTQEKIARIKRKRRAIEQDMREFGDCADLTDEEIEELEWLEYQKEKAAEMRADYLEEKRRGLY